MSTIKITRPTTAALRERFHRLPAKERAAVVALAREKATQVKSASEAWSLAFASLSTRGSGVNRERQFQRAVGHRFINLRASKAECSCGEKYEIEQQSGDAVALRALHAAHKSQVG